MNRSYNVFMRRLPSIATFAFLIALSPALAQMRGGGHGFSGGRGGFAGHMGGGHAFSSMPLRSSGPRFQSRGFGHGFSFRQSSFFRGDRFRGDRFRHHRFRNFSFGNCFGCRRSWGWPWWYAGYYDPDWWWDPHSSYDDDRERQIAEAQEMNTQSLEEQRARREDQDAHAQSDPPPQARGAETTEAPAPSTVLVFRDKREQEVQNYAIVGQTLWNLTLHRTQKIPLADLDLAATAKANDEHGVVFRVPATTEGQ